MFRNFGSALPRGSAALLAIVMLSLVAAGCSSSNTDNTPPDAGPTNCDLTGVEAVFTPKCALSGCHGDSPAGSAAGNLILTAGPNLATRLLGVMSTGANGSSCGAATKAYLIPHVTPATGLLIDKLTMTVPECGSQMPLGSSLPPTELACVKSWAASITAN
jgi:hypothetical protein